MPDFKDYMRLAAKNKKLPSWWKHGEDYRAILRVATTDKWANIRYAVEKADIQAHYEDSSMPMALRMLAEELYGEGIGGY